MSSFTEPLIVEVTQGQRMGRGLVTLCRSFAYAVGELGSGDLVRVPVGFETDFASVPRWGRWLLAPFDRSAKAAVVHDFLLWQEPPHRRPRAEIDAIFLEALAVLEVRPWKRRLMWAAVRLQAWMTGDR